MFEHASTQRPARRAATGLALALCAGLAAVAPPSQASQATGWWGGVWSCRIDGRPAQMKWNVVNASDGSCDGDVCTSTSAVAWKGSFSDNGSRWVPLSNPRPGDKGGLFFNHADGNKWYLSKPVSNKSNGWTTWQGKRYPLSCSR